MKISPKDIPAVVKQYERVFIACHSGPDMDSVSSVWALKKYFESLGVKPSLICVDEIPEDLSFLIDTSEIEIINPIENKNMFSPTDLLVIPDIANWMVFNGVTDDYDPGCKTLRIDHHRAGRIVADYEIVDSFASSTCEMLYGIFEELLYAVDQPLSGVLLAGILTDTGVFVYSNASSKTFEVASKLIGLGADKEKIIFNLFKCTEPDTYKILGILSESMEVFSEGFAFCSIKYSDLSSYPKAGKSPYIDGIIQTVKNTNFGVRVSEKEPGVLYVSFRSRFPELVDVSLLASSLGGGGHKAAAAARLNMEFDKGVEYLKSTCREFAKKYEIPTK